ncbi:unnamed protein product, partial [Mesorhabditis belari]|uniref:Uncharacterized protein n=1 Tax=Mesorhabditis belari TaxID=2138241 RepID=A0AAF3EAP8_9BILA
MPELRPTFVVNFDMSTVICQHSEVATDLHVHEISILCDGQKDCYDNPALDDEIFPYCEKKCNSTCNGRGACLYDGKEPQCFCNQGFSGPACEIIDTNECSSKPCHWFAHCQNTVGSFQCKCFDGFEGDGFHCTDIDECEDGIAQCPANSDCINLPGSHFCNCTQGFAPKGSPLERCEDIDECARGIFKCPANELCENTIGDYKCVNECDVGYKASEGRCVDIDECAVNKTSCHQRASCINTDGSYRCACEKGFAGDGHTCEPINLDCRFNNDICSRHAYCLKGLGLCVCKTGYMGDGLICEDVNECQADPSLCKADEKRCLNIVGGFLCCNSTSDDDRCIKDEAAYCPGGCGTNAACRDEKCQCFPGYHGDPNHECQDVNECEMDDTCKGVGEWCQNLLGTYICCNPKSDSRFCQKPDPAAILFSVDQETVSLDRSAAAGGGFSHYESGGNKASSSGGLIVEEYGSEIVPLNCTSYCPGNSECLQGVCQCKNGYEGDPNQGCQDIDECERKMDNCNESITGHWCVNDEGSYHCCTSINEVDCVGLVLTRSGFEQEAKGGASAAAASSSGFHSNATIEGGVAAGELQQSGQKGAGGQGFIEKGGKKESSSGGLVSVIEGDDDHGEVPDDLLKPKEGETGLVITADGFQTNGTSTEELETLMTTLSGMMTTPLETSTLKGSTASQRGFTGVPVSEIDLTKTTQISQSVTKASSPKIEVSTWSSKQTEHFESSTSTSGKGTFVVHEKGSSSNHSSGGNIKLIDGNAGEFTIKINELTTTPSLEEKTSKPGENGLEISSRKTEPPNITVDGEGTQSEEINDEKHRRKSTTVPPVTEDFDMLKPAPNETGLEITAHGFSEIEPEVPTTSQPDLVLTASPTKNTPLPSPSTQEPTTTTSEVSKTIATISTAATTRKPSGPEIAIDSGEEGDVAGKDGKVTKPGKIIVSIGPSHESTTIKIQSTTASMTSTPSTLSTKSTSQATSAETTTKLTTEVTTSEIPTASATSQQTTKKSSTTVKENVEKTTKQAETSVESTTGVTTVSVDTTKQESTTKTTIAPNPTVSSSEKPAEITKTTSETKTTKVPLKETTSIHVTSKTSLPSSKSVTISPSTSTKTTTKAGIEITQVTKDIGLEITKFTEVTTPSSSSSSSSPTSPTEKTSISTASTKQSVQPVHKVTSSATEKPLVATLTSTSSQITNPTTTTKVDETTTQNVRGPFGRSESPDVSESTQAPLIVTTQQETKRPLTDATQTTTLKPVPAEATIIPKFVCISSDSCGIDAYCERRSGGCRCHPGFQGNPPEERCIDVNECLEGTHNCHETARCHNFVGSYKCFCPQGFRQQSDGSCQDINECNESAGGCCSGNATCHNSPGTYECRCNEGYVGDGYTCIPSQKRACTEEESRSFACGLNNLCMIDDYGKKDCNECKPGFEMKESICVDVDECADANLNMCSKFAICVNTVGTYMCKCKNGFKGDGYMCEDIDECSAGRKPCHGSAECANTEGSYTCTCYEGWIGDGKTACINPMNRECEDLVKTCGTAEHMTCLSARVSNGTVQSVCECEANYRWNSVSKKCEDIDECLEDRHDCDPSNSHCKNIPGGYECECMDGYEGRGGICVDIDECKMGTSGCHHMAMCINRAGSCGCQCMNGYTGDGTSCLVMPPNVTTTMETTTTTKAQTTPTTPTTTTTTLTTPKPNLTTKPSQRATTMQEEESNETERPCPENWIRNCSLYNKKCEVDLEENPQCSSCISGYQPSVNETCIPINGKGGCTPTTCDPHADCQEIPPNQHRCFCRIGYIGDGRKCDDVDECSVPGVCATEAHCVNKDGSFDCLCPAGFTGNGFFCTFIVDREDNVTLPRPNCLIDTGLCHPYAKCSMNGSCVCFDGFEGDGIKVCKSLHLSTKTSPKPTPFTTKESKNISSTGFVTKLTIELGPSTTKAPTQPREKLPVIKTVEQSTKAPLTATLETTASTRHHFGTVLPGCETWPPRNTQSPTTTPTRLPIARATTPLPSVGAISGAKRCTPDDRSACHALALCEPDGVCRCKNGYEGDGYQTCTRVPSIDCVDDPNVCDTRGECNKARRRCECTMGYIGDGIICAPDPQDCVLRHNLCSAEAMCVGRRCQCQPGYTGDGVVCVSIHERETNASACVQNSHFDGAVCKCNVGYLGNGLCCVADPRDCTHFPGICHSNAFCQKEERSCKCNHGYQGNGFSCLPLRSCRSTPTLCHRDALCLPTGDCLCKEGYFGDGLSCKRRGFIGHRENELSDTPSACGNLCNVETELCINAKCECKHGFEKIAGKCTDVNECLVDQPCHQLASCKNLDGSYECTCPDGYHGDGKSCVENVKLGELQVLCEPGQMTLLLENSTELNDGRIFVRGQSENPHCTKQFSAFHRESKPYRFVVPFEHCNVRMEEKDTVAVTVVVQKHPMFITALSDAYDLRCTYPIGVREVESHVNVSDVTPSMTLSDESVGPLCSLVVTNEQQEMVNSAMVGQSLHLTLSVEPSASYAILPKNCFAINIETGERYSLTDRWGCAIDAELFPEWTRVRPSKTQALFRTFKWPDSSMIRFQCDCSACVGDCPPVDCERRRQIAQRLFRFRRARHTGNQEASETEDLMMTNEAFVEHDEEEKLGHSLVNSPRIAFSRLIAVHERREHSNDRSSPKAEESRSEVLKESSDDERVCVRTAILAASTLLFILCLSILIFMGLRHRRKTLQEYPSLPSLS